MPADRDSRRLTAAEVLRRYKEEDLAAFSEIALKDVNQIGNSGDRPIHIAATRGNLDEIAALLDAGAEIDAAGELGDTALHYAVGQQNMAAIELLLERGASAAAKNDAGDTPLDMATQDDREDIVDLLQSRT